MSVDAVSKQASLVALGNPLWDVCVTLPDGKVLSKFGLADDSSTEVTAAEYESILQAVQSYPTEGCPGGAALNTLRVYQWLTHQTGSSIFFGGIGGDETGKKLSSHVSQAGVHSRFKVNPNLLTGSAICLINKNMRTLVAHIGAANVFSREDLTDEDKSLIASAKLVYVENFFFCHSPSLVWDVVQLCKINGVALAFNLSGSYLFQKYGVDINPLIKCVNIVIGNENEYFALSKSSNWSYKEMSGIASNICKQGVQSPETLQSKLLHLTKYEKLHDLGKVVVITRGQKSVLCVSQGKTMFETQVLQPTSDIHDTTGAGDAFAAGFLMGIMENIPLELCVKLGCYASSEIIQRIGCSIPEHMPLAIQQIEKRFEQ